MKKKFKASAYYMGAMLLGVGVLLCASGIENSANGWAMLAWTGAGGVLMLLALVLAGLGLANEQPEKSRKVHQAPTRTVTAGRSSGRKAG